MPYKVAKKGDKHCVVVSSGPKQGKEVACHDTRAKAVAQVRALYANDAASATELVLTPCYDQDCSRAFLTDAQMFEHAEMHDDAREFNAKQRKQAASKGQAQKDGSYPIKNAQDLRNAIQAYGRSKNKAATKAHIIRRARALGLTKLLPDGWGGDKASCPECDRAFRNEDQLMDHAEVVH